MEVLLLIFLIGAIVYTRYNNFKANKRSEELHRFHMAEIEEFKRRERMKGNIK